MKTINGAKKTMKRRVLSLLIAMAMMVTMLPVAMIMASAEDGPGVDLLLSGFNILGGQDLIRQNVKIDFINRNALEEFQIHHWTGGTRVDAEFSTTKNVESLASSMNIVIDSGFESKAGVNSLLFKANASTKFGLKTTLDGSHSTAYERHFSMLRVQKELGRNYINNLDLSFHKGDIWESNVYSAAFKAYIADGGTSPDTIFDNYGTHVITSVKIGGYAESTTTIVKTEFNEKRSINTAFNLSNSGGGKVAGIEASVSANLDLNTAITGATDVEGFNSNSRADAVGGTGGQASALGSTSTLSDYQIWLDSIQPTIPKESTDIIIDDTLSFVGIWELLPDTQQYAARKNELRLAYLNRAKGVNTEFFEQFVYSTVRVPEQPGLPEPEFDDTFNIITTAAQLNAIRNNLSGNYILANDITFSGSWTPIGTADEPFTGVIEGNVNTIRGLNADFIGVNEGTIRSLQVVYTARAGGVAGINNGTVKDCYADWEFAFDADYKTAASIPSHPNTLAGTRISVDISGLAEDALDGKTIVVPNTAMIVKFKGDPEKTYTGLNIIVNGNTDVVFEDFNYRGTGVANPSLTLSGANPAIISIGTISNRIFHRARMDASLADLQGYRAVVEAVGNVYICGNADLTIDNVEMTTTTPDGLSGKGALWVGGTLNIAIDADLTAIGGDGRGGANGSNGANRGTISTPRQTGGDGTHGQDGGHGGHGISANAVNILNGSNVYLTGGDGKNGGIAGVGGRGSSVNGSGSGTHWGGNGGNAGNGGHGGNGGTPLNANQESFYKSPDSYLILTSGKGGKGRDGGGGGTGGQGGTGSVRTRGGDGGNGGNGGNGGFHGIFDVVGGIIDIDTGNKITGQHYGEIGGNRGGGGTKGNDPVNVSTSVWPVQGPHGTAGTSRATIADEYLTYIDGTPTSAKPKPRINWQSGHMSFNASVARGTGIHRNTLVYNAGETFDESGLSVAATTILYDFSEPGETLVTVLQYGGDSTQVRYIPAIVESTDDQDGCPECGLNPCETPEECYPPVVCNLGGDCGTNPCQTPEICAPEKCPHDNEPESCTLCNAVPEFILGRVLSNEQEIGIMDALEILKYLAGIPNVITTGGAGSRAWNAALITGEGSAPGIMDALEILKKLAGIDGVLTIGD